MPNPQPDCPGWDILTPHLTRWQGQTPFVGLMGVRQWAQAQGLGEREAICALLGHGVWPERFRRNCSVLSAAEMVRLLRARVLVLGCGGLGGHVAGLLARLGVGFLRLCDADSFEESNLNRQLYCTEDVLGRPKVAVVADGVRRIASYIEVEQCHTWADADTMPALVQGMDAVMDCLDSIPARKLLEQSALAAGAAFVHGAVLREEGFAFLNDKGAARLPLMYPDGDDAAEQGVGAEGILATSPAAIACLMCALLLKHLTGRAVPASLWHFDCSVPELNAYSLD